MSLSGLDAREERDAIAALEDALELPPESQVAFLETHVSLSASGKRRALKLLQSHSSGASALMTGGASFASEEEPLPERIGAYRLLRLIGRGGMGNVYLAERAERDFDLAVAIKVIKKRLITPQMVDRFRSERQILADLNHPNIGRLFDGGETDSGAPYFVMEFVDGLSLDRWLENETRSLDDRLSVFRQVCSAVQAAHQRLIVHRDLTPPNVLVTEFRVAKVIDFGIARSEESDEKGHVAFSDYTPGYAAPEQRLGAAASTLSDVYALGKLLEFLLEGESNSELSAIARKAASESQEARYQSVSMLIEDIENFLADRPVAAVEAGFAYFTAKLIKRQTAFVAVTGASIFALLLAFALVVHASRQAENAQALAEQRLAEMQGLAGTMMFDLFDAVSDRPGNTEARLMLARNAQQYLEDLASGPNASNEARLAAGRGFFRLAAATGSFETGNAGEIAKGIAFYDRSIAILSDLYAEAPSDAVALALARSLVAASRDKTASYSDLAGAVQHAEDARKVLLAVAKPDAAVVAELGRAERYLGDGLGCCNGRVDEGAAAIKRGLEQLGSAPASIRKDPLVRRAYNDLINLSAGFVIFEQGDAEGIPIFREALRNQRALVQETGAPEDQRLEATISANLARTLLRLGEVRDAGEVITPTHERTLLAYRADPQDNDLQRRLAVTSFAMARVAAEGGRRVEANRLIEQGISLARGSEGPAAVLGIPSLNLAHRLHEAAQAYRANSESDRACAVARKSIKLYLDYAERNELPITTLRYRLAPLRQMEASCPT